MQLNKQKYPILCAGGHYEDNPRFEAGASIVQQGG
jgi:hypothetical protein